MANLLCIFNFISIILDKVMLNLSIMKTVKVTMISDTAIIINSDNHPYHEYHITSLTPYTRYIVQVRAATMEGDQILWGNWSDTVQVKTSQAGKLLKKLCISDCNWFCFVLRCCHVDGIKIIWLNLLYQSWSLFYLPLTFETCMYTEDVTFFLTTHKKLDKSNKL